jgi:hypothetical protein
MTKICIRCEKEKELNEFSRGKKSKDGYRNQYKACLNDLAKIRFDNLSEEEKNRRRAIKNQINRKFWENNIDDPEFKLKQKNRRREYHLNKLETDPIYKIKIAYSRRLNKYLRRGKCDKSDKVAYFLDKLGCTFEEFKLYLESKFEGWMSWENYGKYNGELNYGWDIDHITPLSKAKTEDDIYNLSHYSNLQPLCSRINRDIKKNKKENPQ